MHETEDWGVWRAVSGIYLKKKNNNKKKEFTEPYKLQQEMIQKLQTCDSGLNLCILCNWTRTTYCNKDILMMV